jgi:hypothetical protein
MHPVSQMKLELALAAACVAGACPSTVSADSAPAALLKAVRVSIETRGGPGAARAFTLTSLEGRGARDAGASLRTAAWSGPARQVLSGRELLRGARGSLSVRFVGRRTSAGNAAVVMGRWVVSGASGYYAGLFGHGRFSADVRLTVTHYRGLLISAA